MSPLRHFAWTIEHVSVLSEIQVFFFKFSEHEVLPRLRNRGTETAYGKNARHINTCTETEAEINASRAKLYLRVMSDHFK